MRTASTNEDLAQQHTQPTGVEAVGWVIQANDPRRSLDRNPLPAEPGHDRRRPAARTLTSSRPALPATNPGAQTAKPRLIRTDIAVLFVGDQARPTSRHFAARAGGPLHHAGYDGSPLVMLRLAQVNPARPKELVTDAWRMRDPDALVGDLAAAD